jgi:hypothetical protein
LVVEELAQTQITVKELVELILFLVLRVHLLQQLAEVEVVQKIMHLPDAELLEVQVEVEFKDVLVHVEPEAQEILLLFLHP